MSGSLKPPPDTTSSISVEETTTAAALEALRTEWSDLWQRCPRATPFQSPEWLLPWWRHFGQGELLALALRCQERLIGLAPLFVHTGDRSRRLLLIGTGNSDYLDLLISGDEAAAMAAIFAHLAARRDRWDVCDFQQLRPGSPLLEAPAPAGWREEKSAQEPCPALSLPARAEELSRSIPENLFKKIERYRRRAARMGSLSLDSARPENWEELFEALVRLHSARWSGRRLPGVLCDETVVNFHREALPGLLSLGVPRLYALRIDGRVVAALYSFIHRSRVYAYLAGFDPEFGRLSAGTLLLACAIEEAVRAGASEFDFLRGRESYKYAWGGKDRPTYRRRLWPREAECF